MSGSVLLPQEGANLNYLSEDRRDWPRFHTDADYPDPLAPRAHASGGVSIPAAPTELNIDALCFQLDIDDQTSDNTMASRSTVREIGNWLATFRSWIGLWTQLPQTEEVRRLHPFTVILGEQDGGLVPDYFPGIAQTAYTTTRLVDETMFVAATAAASRGEDIPEDRTFLVRAQHMIGVNDFRASVIDSCTAAEIALSRWIKEEFEHRYDSTLARELLKDTRGVAALFKIYLAARGSELTFRQIREELAQPRNQAVHEGATIQQQVAEASHATSTQLINELAPIQYP